MGLTADEEEKKEILAQVKHLSLNHKRLLNEEEFRQIVEQVKGL